MVFEGGDSGSEIEIRSQPGINRGEQEEISDRIIKEIGKYLLLTDTQEEPRPRRRELPRERRDEDRLPPRLPRRALPYRQQDVDHPYSGLAIAGFVCSLCSLIFIVFLSLPLAIVGCCLSLAARTQSNRTSGQGMAIAGMVIGLVVLAIWLILIVAVSRSRYWYW